MYKDHRVDHDEDVTEWNLYLIKWKFFPGLIPHIRQN